MDAQPDPQKTSTLKRYVSIPAVTTTVILLGFFNITHHYELYGIEIASYIEVPEIIFFFGNIFLVVTIVGLITFVQIVSFLRETKIWETSRKELILSKELKAEVETREFRVSQILRPIFIVIFIGMIVLITWSYSGGEEGIEQAANTPAFSFDCLYLLSISALVGVVIFSPTKANTIDERLLYALPLMIFLFITYFIVRNNLSYRFIESGIPKYEVSIYYKTNGPAFHSTDSILYVGSVKNFIFLFNRHSKTSVIIPMSQVDRLTIHQKRRGL